MSDAQANGARPQQRQTPAAIASGRGGEPLSRTVRSYFEPRFGRDFADVRVHTDAQAVHMSRLLRAEAFTYGSDIYFNERRFAPASAAGKHLLAHELVHTIQQRGAIGRQIQRREVCDENGMCRSEPGSGDRSEDSAAPNASQNVMPSSTHDVDSPVASVLPAPAASLRPPGLCTVPAHRTLQEEVDRSCDRDTRCTQDDLCPALWEKIGFNAECIRARARINARCFGGGNVGHRIALANAILGLGRCWLAYSNKCQPKAPPVAVPHPVSEPEKKPTINKSVVDRIAAITGLTGSALAVYIVLSEGSRLLLPRNAVPIP